MAGFASAEGCFLIRIYKAQTKTGEAVKLVFQLTQHVRDGQLMRSFIKYINCGNICKSRESFVYRVDKFSDELASPSGTTKIKLFLFLINIKSKG